MHAANIALSGEGPDYFADYKIKDVANEYRSRRGPTADSPAVLDFGAGIGTSVPFVRNYLPRARLICLDVSTRSLAVGKERFPGEADFVAFDGATIPAADASFDIVFATCVFHHIGHDEYPGLLREFGRILAPGGMAFVFEHNPMNPLTVHAVNTCPFDANARLVRARVLQRRFGETGFGHARIRYRIFFPHALRTLRPLEKMLT